MVFFVTAVRAFCGFSHHGSSVVGLDQQHHLLSLAGPQLSPKGWCAVRVTDALVVIPLKTVPGLVPLPIAQRRGCLPAVLSCWEMPVIAPLPFDLLELFRTRSANYSSPFTGEAGLVQPQPPPTPFLGLLKQVPGRGDTHTTSS